MITGDSMLTALHAAKECSIIGVKRNAEHSLIENNRFGEESEMFDGSDAIFDGEISNIDRDNAKSTSIQKKNKIRDNNDSNGSRVQDNIKSSTLVLTIINEKSGLIDSGRNSGISGSRSLVWCDDGGVVKYRYSHGALRKEKGAISSTVQEKRNRRVDNRNRGVNKSVNKSVDKKRGRDRDRDRRVNIENKTSLGSVNATLNIDDRNPLKDEYSDLPSFSVRELSDVGGFDLGISGEAALFFRNDVWDGGIEGLKELSLFKVRTYV